MIFERYKQLANVFAPSGREKLLAEKIKELVAPHVDDISIDIMGNVIAHKKGAGARLMLSAHMDSIGMAITFIDSKGFLRFGAVGGLSRYDLINTPIIFENGTRGIISYEEKADIKKITLDDLYIDIGTNSYEESLKYVNVGDFAVFSSEAYIMGDTMVGPYMDDRIGCTILSLLAQEIKKSEFDLYYVFSVSEEVGMRGAITASFAIEPDIGIAIDVTDTGDTPGKKNKMSACLGGGACIKIMDASLISNQDLVADLEASTNGIKFQREILTFGGTDAGAMQKSRAGVVCSGISVPTRYIHSPVEMVNINDVQGAIDILKNYINKTKL